MAERVTEPAATVTSSPAGAVTSTDDVTAPGHGVTVVVLQSDCCGCGKRAHNFLADRRCFAMLCPECVDSGASCACQPLWEDDLE